MNDRMPRRSARFVVLLLLVLVAAAGCKQEITSGDYGPVTIGQPKLEALAALKANGLWPIRPILYSLSLATTFQPTRRRDRLCDDARRPHQAGAVA